jgi:2-oxoglutarate ferredoxin oxidoreductase subunit alpha
VYICLPINSKQLKKNTQKTVLTDGSMIITEACVQSGAEVFIGYPITPSNRFYQYASNRFPLFLAGPDEITVMQWMAGIATTGKFPVTSTAFPGFALMVEGFNMAYAMELPMLLILTQRLGPSTGSATTGAQGDLGVINGSISGGYPVPVFCPSGFEDGWKLTNEAIKTAINLRTPVVLLTSKEMIMTNKSFDLSTLEPIEKIEKGFKETEIEEPFLSYRSGESLVPPYVPVGNDKYKVRINASTHDDEGLIRKDNPESLANTKRLREKIDKRLHEYSFHMLDEDGGNKDLIVTYGISSESARDAVNHLRKEGYKVSLLVVQTLLPVAPELYDIMDRFDRLHIVEENLNGIYREILFGKGQSKRIKGVNQIGKMITPNEIINSVKS